MKIIEFIYYFDRYHNSSRCFHKLANSASNQYPLYFYTDPINGKNGTIESKTI